MALTRARAHEEMEAHWDNGTLLTLGKSRTSSLAETLLHVWRELLALGATFTLVKLPGHAADWDSTLHAPPLL